MLLPPQAASAGRSPQTAWYQEGVGPTSPAWGQLPLLLLLVKPVITPWPASNGPSPDDLVLALALLDTADLLKLRCLLCVDLTLDCPPHSPTLWPSQTQTNMVVLHFHNRGPQDQGATGTFQLSLTPLGAHRDLAGESHFRVPAQCPCPVLAWNSQASGLEAKPPPHGL